MAIADRLRRQAGGRSETMSTEEVPQRIEDEQRLALVRSSLLTGVDDVVGCGGVGAHDEAESLPLTAVRSKCQPAGGG